MQHNIRVFPILGDGRLGPGRIFASGIVSASEPGVPDGMKCDAQGNLWVCGPGGVWVYTIKGELIGKLRVPELVGNLTWGGSDWRTLFLTATHSLYAVETKTGPRLEPYMKASGGQGARGETNRASEPVAGVKPAATIAASGAKKAAAGYRLDPMRCALIIQDMHRHRGLDQHVDLAHGAPRRRQGLCHAGAGGRLLDHERRVARCLGQLRAAECLRRDGYRGRHQRHELTGCRCRRANGKAPLRQTSILRARLSS